MAEVIVIWTHFLSVAAKGLSQWEDMLLTECLKSNSHLKTPHILPSSARYRMSIASILEKISHVTRPHCTFHLMIFSANIPFLTSVCTMAGRWVRSILHVWNISTTPSYRILSSTILRLTNTPVRPTPALKTNNKQWMSTQSFYGMVLHNLLH